MNHGTIIIDPAHHTIVTSILLFVHVQYDGYSTDYAKSICLVRICIISTNVLITTGIYKYSFCTSILTVV